MSTSGYIMMHVGGNHEYIGDVQFSDINEGFYQLTPPYKS